MGIHCRFRVEGLLSLIAMMAPPPSPGSPFPARFSPEFQQQMDAIELLLQDLGSVDPDLQHRASFQSCWRELSLLRSELVSLLVSRRRLVREATAAGAEPPQTRQQG